MMKQNKRTPSPVDFCEQQVLPEVFARLSEVFPELKWKRTDKGWSATDRAAKRKNPAPTLSSRNGTGGGVRQLENSRTVTAAGVELFPASG
jgi:hypothetical protein